MPPAIDSRCARSYDSIFTAVQAEIEEEEKASCNLLIGVPSDTHRASSSGRLPFASSNALPSKIQSQMHSFQRALDKFLDNKDALTKELLLHQQRFMEVLDEQSHGMLQDEVTDDFVPEERCAIVAVASDGANQLASPLSSPGSTLNMKAAISHGSSDSYENTLFPIMEATSSKHTHGDPSSEEHTMVEEAPMSPRTARFRETLIANALAVPNFLTSVAKTKTDSTQREAHSKHLPNHWRAVLMRKRSSFSTIFNAKNTRKIVTKRKEYEVFMGCVILMNAIYIGFDLQYEGIYVGYDFDEHQVGALCFVGVYLIDLLIRFYHEKWHFFCGFDCQWNLFDFVIVMICVVDVTVKYATQGQRTQMRLEWMRTIRLLRLVRVLHVTRFLKIFREFRLLMYSIQKSLGALFWVVTVCGLFVYLFAIALAQAALEYCKPATIDEPTCEKFGKLSHSILHLYKAMFGGLLWGELFDTAKPLGDMYPFVILFFSSFSAVVIMNLVTGVLLDILHEIANTEKETMIRDTLKQKREYAKKMQDVFDELDVNSSGGISLEEFKYAVKEPRMIALLDSLGLDFGDVSDVFDLLDRDKTGAVDVEEFVLGCMRIKGGARTLDLMKLQQYSEQALNIISDVSSRLDEMQLQQVNGEQAKVILDMAPSNVNHHNSEPVSKASLLRRTMKSATMDSTGEVSRSIEANNHAWNRIDIVEERAMNVRELQSVLMVVQQQCMIEEWFNKATGERLDVDSVNLYDFDYNCISPRTIPDGVVLHGLPVQSAGCTVGQRIIQRRKDCETAVLAEGIVQDDASEGKIKVAVIRGRFMVDSDAFPNTCILVEGSDVGVPSEVQAPVSLSYKELISQTPTKPKWFCSHWWGEAISDFVSCCETHTQLRGMTELESSYWICAYANRQHELAADISNDPDNSSFKKAMNAAKGVLLVLDRDATPFKRIWCDFELYNTIADNKPLDIVTVHDENGLRLPQLLCQGLLPRETIFNKTRREAKFPLTLLACGLHSRLEDGDATVQIDKEHILRYMALDYKKRKTAWQGDVIDADALALALEHANSILHSYLALAAWPQAVRKNRVDCFDLTKPGTLRLPKIVSRDLSMKNFQLSLAHLLEVTDVEMNHIGQGLPRNLKKLQLSFEGCFSIGDDGVLSLMNNIPSEVQTLHLDFLGCRNITDQGLKHLAVRLPDTLRELRLDFAACDRIGTSGLNVLRQNLPKKLERFAATFQGTEIDRKFKSVAELNRFVAGVPLKNAFKSISAKAKLIKEAL